MQPEAGTAETNISPRISHIFYLALYIPLAWRLGRCGAPSEHLMTKNHDASGPGKVPHCR